MGDDPFHQLAAVIALAVRLDEGAHRVGIGGETEDIARAVRRAVRLHKALPPVFIGGGVLRHDPGDALAVALPLARDIYGDGIAVFGVGNGGGEELGERLCAKARIERRPARGRARDHRGEPALFGDSGKAFCANLVRAQRQRRNAAGVQAVELFLLLDPHERETVGPKAVARRLEQRHRAGHGDGGIDGMIHTTDDLGYRETILMQMKNRHAVMTAKDVREFYGAVCAENGSRGIFITLSSFHPEAQKLLDKVDNLTGVNGDKLFEIAKRCRLGLVEKDGRLCIDEELLLNT